MGTTASNPSARSLASLRAMFLSRRSSYSDFFPSPTSRSSFRRRGGSSSMAFADEDGGDSRPSDGASEASEASASSSSSSSSLDSATSSSASAGTTSAVVASGDVAARTATASVESAGSFASPSAPRRSSRVRSIARSMVARGEGEGDGDGDEGEGDEGDALPLPSTPSSSIAGRFVPLFTKKESRDACCFGGFGMMVELFVGEILFVHSACRFMLLCANYFYFSAYYFTR